MLEVHTIVEQKSARAAQAKWRKDTGLNKTAFVFSEDLTG